MNELIERIKEVLDWSRLSQRAFAKKIDYSTTSFNNYVLGKRDGMDGALLMNILSTFVDINPDWLLRGEGEMLREVDGIIRDDGVAYKPYTPAPTEFREMIEMQRDIIREQKDLIKTLQEQIKMQSQIGLNDKPDAQEGGAVGCADASGW